MQNLNKLILISQRSQATVTGEQLLNLPERILQFGNGVLLRGLPDFYVDQANKQGVFNGRIVVVKTTPGNVENFAKQDYLYTHYIKGIQEGMLVDTVQINSAISRVLPAETAWSEVLTCAENPEINIVFSNTTEQGLVYLEEKTGDGVPASFPGKLMEYLYHRFNHLGFDESSKMCIIPTELIEFNGDKLKQFLLDLSSHNQKPEKFTEWLISHVIFCNSLVDRIVPGKPDRDKLQQYELEQQYTDQYLIESEPYNLWAIEGPEMLHQILSFAQCNPGIKITEDISLYKELKLRLLNATHTFTAAKALLTGHKTVFETMSDQAFFPFISSLTEEIKTAIPKEIPDDLKDRFGADVLDRFRNANIRHYWSSIIFNYAEKFKIRCVPLVRHFYTKNAHFAPFMMEGLAAYFKVTMPDLKENDEYYSVIHGEKIKLNDPLTTHIVDYKNQFGTEALIREHIDNYLMEEGTAKEKEDLIKEVIRCFQSLN